MKYLLHILSLSTLLASASSGCLKDACNKEPTFQSIEAADILKASGNAYYLRATFAQGQVLPAAYYKPAKDLRAGQIYHRWSLLSSRYPTLSKTQMLAGI